MVKKQNNLFVGNKDFLKQLLLGYSFFKSSFNSDYYYLSKSFVKPVSFRPFD